MSLFCPFCGKELNNHLIATYMGTLSRGKKKNITDEERQRRRDQMAENREKGKINKNK